MLCSVLRSSINAARLSNKCMSVVTFYFLKHMQKIQTFAYQVKFHSLKKFKTQSNKEQRAQVNNGTPTFIWKT